MTRQNKTREDKTRQDKTTQDKIRQHKTREDTRQAGDLFVLGGKAACFAETKNEK